LVSNNFNI